MNSNRAKRARILMHKPNCIYCGAVLTLDTSTLEHLTPKSMGGSDADSNLALACWTCNNRRGNDQRYFVRHKIAQNQRRVYQRTGIKPKKRQSVWTYYGKGSI